MFQERRHHHPAALSRDKPASLGSCWGSVPSQAQGLLCGSGAGAGACLQLSMALPKELCWPHRELAGSCQTSPTDSESNKGLGGMKKQRQMQNMQVVGEVAWSRGAPLSSGNQEMDT